MSDASLIVRIGASSKAFQDELAKVKRSTEDLEQQLSAIAKISGLAFAALTAEIVLSVKAFAESEAASNKLTQALINQGMSADKLIGVYKTQAKEIEELTGIDDDALVMSQARIQALIGQTEISRELTQAIADLSTETGNLDSAAEILGRGIAGNTKGLKQFGIVVSENLTQEERMAVILEKVAQKYGGQAEAANQGVGSIKGFQTAIGNLQEAIGAKFAPSLVSATKSITAFISKVEKNDALIGFIADNMKLAGVITGLGVVVSAGALGFIKLKAVIEASSIAMRLFGTSTRAALVTSGIGIAVVALTEAFIYFSNKAQEGTAKATKEIRSHKAEIQDLQKEIRKLEEERPDLSKLQGYHLQQYENGKKARITALKKTLEEEEALEKEYQTKKSREQAGGEAAAKQREQQQLELESRQAHIDAIALQSQLGSEKLAQLKQQESETLKAMAEASTDEEYNALVDKYNRLTELQAEQQALDAEQRAILKDQILAENEEFEALSDEQKAAFLQKHQQQLQEEILTEKTARDQAALDRSKQQIDANNRFLLEQQKFGTAYATINQAMHSAQFQGTKQAFGELAQLQQSENSKLKAIGKVAALANIVIKTAESAMNIYAGFSVIPIIGPALGIAGAAAAIAFGAEQFQKVSAAAEGGIMTGGIPGRDSIPALLTPGELVVPTRNYEEVVNSVAASRSGTSMSNSGTFSGSEVASVLASIESNLRDINAKFSNPTTINGDILADDIYIDAIVRRISEAIEWRNAKLITSPVGV